MDRNTGFDETPVIHFMPVIITHLLCDLWQWGRGPGRVVQSKERDCWQTPPPPPPPPPTTTTTSHPTNLWFADRLDPLSRFIFFCQVPPPFTTQLCRWIFKTDLKGDRKRNTNWNKWTFSDRLVNSTALCLSVYSWLSVDANLRSSHWLPPNQMNTLTIQSKK